MQFRRILKVVISVGVGLLSTRIIIASLSDPSSFWATFVLNLTCVILGALCPAYAFFAFTAAVPLLTGLDQCALLHIHPAGQISFSSLFLGCGIRTIFIGLRDTGVHRRSIVEQSPVNNLSQTLAEYLSVITLFSVGLQIFDFEDKSYLWSSFWSQATSGFEEKTYFLSSSLLWLQGIMYFIILCELAKSNIRWLRPIFAVHTCTLVLGSLLQYYFGIPERSNNTGGIGVHAPLEDISSYGSIIVILLIYWSTMISSHAVKRRLEGCIGFLAMSLLLIVSWSRAAWLAAALSLITVVYLKLNIKWRCIVVAAIASLVVAINLTGNLSIWHANSYAYRLYSLVRIEKLTDKMPDRLNLYHKAAAMIAERPLIGHGIGAFYVTSTRYGSANDPAAGQPNFAHNTFLQFAAELGIPAVALFIGIIVIGVWQSRSVIKLKDPDQKSSYFGVILGLNAYLFTQMTANSLNIYFSNQIIFWCLMAILANGNVSRASKTSSTERSLPEATGPQSPC